MQYAGRYEFSLLYFAKETCKMFSNKFNLFEATCEWTSYRIREVHACDIFIKSDNFSVTIHPRYLNSITIKSQPVSKIDKYLSYQLLNFF